MLKYEKMSLFDAPPGSILMHGYENRNKKKIKRKLASKARRINR